MRWDTVVPAAATAAASHFMDLISVRALSAQPGSAERSESDGALLEASRWFWIVGVVATLMGSTLTVLGFMVQKVSHQYSRDGGRWYWTDWRWLFGLVLWLLGQVLCCFADGIAPRSLLACFNCWNIVIVFALAPLCFGEAIDRKAFLGAGVTMLGCVWVVLAGPRDYQTHTVDSINKAWSSFPSVLVIATTAVYLAVAGSWGRLASPLARWPPVELAALSAAFAWYAMLLSKCVSTLLVTSVSVENQMEHWEFWLFMVGMLVCAALQMHTLNMGLKFGRSVDVLPTYEALSMTGQIIICGTFFSEFQGFGLWDMISFASGVSCVLAGVTGLVRCGEKAGVGEDRPLTASAAPPVQA